MRSTAAAIDRVVHHSIIEFGNEIKNMPMEEVAKRSQQPLPVIPNME